MSENETTPDAPTSESNSAADESADDEISHFDAVRAAAELADTLGGAELGGSDYVRSLEGEIDRLTALVEEKDQFARAAAVSARQAAEEAEKVKVRVERDAVKSQETRRRDLFCDFLEVLDDLDRALEAAKTVDHNPAVIEGIELVRRRFVAKLEGHKIVRVESMGETFDPAIHDAVAQVPVADAAQNGKIVGVVLEGYQIGGDVLRAAKVAVGKNG